MKKEACIIFQKLVRDKIPEIIKSEGKECFTKVTEGSELHQAIGAKILEEAYELFVEWQKREKFDILKESADMLEIILKGLEQYDFTLQDLLDKRDQLNQERGGFKNGIFLESVGSPFKDECDFQDRPTLVFNPKEQNRLFDIIKNEFKRSRTVEIASAFYSPCVINLLLSEFEQFVQDGGKLRVLLSTMGNFNRSEYLTHLSNKIPGIQTRIFHPPNISFDHNPPNFHIKIWLFHHNKDDGALIIGSSNFTAAGFCKNHEWNYYSCGEINLPFFFKEPV